MAYDWLSRKLYLAGTTEEGLFEVWSIADLDGAGGVMSLLHSTRAEVVQAQMAVNPFSG